jgi:hypothetical protein
LESLLADVSNDITGQCRDRFGHHVNEEVGGPLRLLVEGVLELLLTEVVAPQRSRMR